MKGADGKKRKKRGKKRAGKVVAPCGESLASDRIKKGKGFWAGQARWFPEADDTLSAQTSSRVRSNRD